MGCAERVDSAGERLRPGGSHTSCRPQRLQQEWEQRHQEITTQLRIANQQLQQQLDGQPSVTQSIHNLFQLFFRTRGRNLLFACLAFALCWLLFYWLLGLIARVSPLHRHGLTFAARLFNVVYMGLTILSALPLNLTRR